jgi:probable HAF family extracellular repeat protein
MRGLGTLGGTFSTAMAVSGNIVVGESDTAAGQEHAFAYDLGTAAPKMRDLGTLGSDYTQARAVSGNIVVGDSDTAAGQIHAFAYDLGAAAPKMRDLGTLGGTFSAAMAVSGNIVVGGSDTAAGEKHAFTYDLGAASPTMRDLGTLGGGYSQALAVSGNIVVGESQTSAGQIHAFTYDWGAASPAMRDLGTLRGGIDSHAVAVSGKIIVGSSSTEPGSCSRTAGIGCGTHAFAYDLGAAAPKMRDLGTLGGIGTSDANAVSGNIIVGFSTTASEDSEGSTEAGDAHGFYYDLAAAPAQMSALGDLGSASSQAPGRVSTVASRISGNIVVGSSTAPDGVAHAVAWKLAP